MNALSKVVLITGCSTGIGRDLAARLSQAGYRVAATARNAETLADLPAALKLSLDVTQPDSVNKAVMHIHEQFGRIDVLVNNAGYAQVGAVEEIPIEKVQQMFEVNVFGVLRHQEAEPEVVSQVIQQAIEAPKPKARYHANIPYCGELVLHLGDSFWDLALRRMFKIDPSNMN